MFPNKSMQFKVFYGKEQMIDTRFKNNKLNKTQK